MIKKCEFCVSFFNARLSKNKFCSQKCYHRSVKGKKSNKNIFGEKNPNWKGGKRTDKDGYFLTYSPKHPNRNCNGYVLEHRLVMENHLKRLLLKAEIVHHLDGNRKNNNIKNLQLLSKVDHDRLTARERRERGFKIEKYRPEKPAVKP